MSFDELHVQITDVIGSSVVTGSFNLIFRSALESEYPLHGRDFPGFVFELETVSKALQLLRGSI